MAFNMIPFHFLAILHTIVGLREIVWHFLHLDEKKYLCNINTYYKSLWLIDAMPGVMEWYER